MIIRFTFGLMPLNVMTAFLEFVLHVNTVLSLISARGAFEIRIEYLPLIDAISILFYGKLQNFLLILCYQQSAKRREGAY